MCVCVCARARACVRACVSEWMDGVSVTADMTRLRLSECPTEAGDGLAVRTSNQKLKARRSHLRCHGKRHFK